MAQRLVSSKRETKQASAASWRARTAELWNRSSCLNSWAISLTSLWKGSFLMRRSVDFWYFLISLRATVPGLKRWGFLTPVVTGALFLAIFWATSCFLGTFWAVDFLAVCLVLAIYPNVQLYSSLEYPQPPIPNLQKINYDWLLKSPIIFNSPIFKRQKTHHISPHLSFIPAFPLLLRIYP